MVRVLFDICVCILAVFGAISLIIAVVNSVCQRTQGDNPNVRLVLVVKDQGDMIEGIIRNIFTGDFLSKVMSKKKLIVFDMGSTDDTVNILIKLKKSYEYMDILGIEDKEKLFDCLNSETEET